MTPPTPTPHRPAAPGTPLRRRCSSRQWRKLRDQVITRDGWRCQLCAAPTHPRCTSRGCDRCTHVGHITAWADGGPDEAWNLRVECQRCNLVASARRSTALRAAKRVLARGGDGTAGPRTPPFFLSQKGGQPALFVVSPSRERFGYLGSSSGLEAGTGEMNAVTGAVRGGRDERGSGEAAYRLYRHTQPDSGDTRSDARSADRRWRGGQVLSSVGPRVAGDG